MSLATKPQHLRVNGESIAYRDTGENAAPLVMLHGWPQSSYVWEPVVETLRPGLRCIRPDLPGLGDSSRILDRNRYLKNALAQDIISLCEALNLESIGIIGHDWGSAVAQEVAYVRPELVKFLIVSQGMPILNYRQTLRNVSQSKISGARTWYQNFQLTSLPDRLLKGNEGEWIRHFLREWSLRYEAISPGAIDEYVRCYSIEHTPITGANYYRTAGRDIKRWLRYQGKIKVPTLLLFADSDPVLPLKLLRGHEAAFETSRLQTIHAGHFLFDEEPKAAGDAILEFVENVLQ